jgi:hypothetical protein
MIRPLLRYLLIFQFTTIALLTGCASHQAANTSINIRTQNDSRMHDLVTAIMSRSGPDIPNVSKTFVIVAGDSHFNELSESVAERQEPGGLLKVVGFEIHIVGKDGDSIENAVVIPRLESPQFHHGLPLDASTWHYEDGQWKSDAKFLIPPNVEEIIRKASEIVKRWDVAPEPVEMAPSFPSPTATQPERN